MALSDVIGQLQDRAGIASTDQGAHFGADDEVVAAVRVRAARK